MDWVLVVVHEVLFVLDDKVLHTARYGVVCARDVNSVWTHRWVPLRSSA
jgi:hypothetical protein